MRALGRWLPLVAYLALVTFLSSRPGHTLPRWWFMRYDKVLHFLEYGGVGFLFSNVLPPSVRPRARVIVATLCGLGFGVLDEFHQSFVPGRQGNDLGDMTADLVGSFAGAISFVLLAHLITKKKELAS